MQNMGDRQSVLWGIHYLHKSHNTPLLPPPPPPKKKKKKKNLHRHCFRLLLGHFHVPGEIANNGYAKVLGGNRGVLWDCASSEYENREWGHRAKVLLLESSRKLFFSLIINKLMSQLHRLILVTRMSFKINETLLVDSLNDFKHRYFEIN